MSEYCKYCGQKYNDLRSLVLNSCLHNPNGRKHEPYEGGLMATSPASSAGALSRTSVQWC